MHMCVSILFLLKGLLSFHHILLSVLDWKEQHIQNQNTRWQFSPDVLSVRDLT